MIPLIPKDIWNRVDQGDGVTSLGLGASRLRTLGESTNRNEVSASDTAGLALRIPTHVATSSAHVCMCMCTATLRPFSSIE